MKSFKVYRNIRQRALIFGLPISFFALQVAGVIGSLLIVIFSFSLSMILAAIGINLAMYVILLKLTHQPGLFVITKVFPKELSNKKDTSISYEVESK